MRNEKGQFMKVDLFTIKCKLCGKDKEVYPCVKNTTKFCSRECWRKYIKSHINKGAFKKGNITWCTGKHPEILSGKNSYNWKGDKVKYRALHDWVRKYKGKPEICEHCGATIKDRRLCWANIDHKYRRNLNDFISLCYSCHKKYDLKMK